MSFRMMYEMCMSEVCNRDITVLVDQPAIAIAYPQYLKLLTFQ